MKQLLASELNLNEVKPFVLANVKLQCERKSTARMCILGSPGCGKSDLIRQICQENGWGLVVKYISNMSLEQISGIPCRVEDGDHARFTKPEIFNFDELDYRPENYEVGKTVTVLLIDDFHLADKIIQKYLFQLLTYKAINSYHLPENTAIIMAGNKMTDKALAHTIPAPVMNRISVYEVKADKKDWIQNFAFANGVRDDIISFINSRGDQFLCQEPIESSPWASPRSWTYLSEQMDSYEKMFGNLPIEKLAIIANGLVGVEYSSEFIAYREIFSKWNIGALMKKSEKELEDLFQTEISKNAVNAYAIINSTMSWMISATKERGFDAKDETVKKIVNFAYIVMTTVLNMKCHGVQIKPLIIAGLNYLYMYTMSTSKDRTVSKKFQDIRFLFLKNMEQQRDIDWIFYEIVATVFDIELDNNDKIAIENAKKNLQV